MRNSTTSGSGARLLAKAEKIGEKEVRLTVRKAKLAADRVSD